MRPSSPLPLAETRLTTAPSPLPRVAGKHSMKKDEYLATMMQVPEKQKIAIVPFDTRTQREAFSIGLDGLKGVRLSCVCSRRRGLTGAGVQWNMTALVAESPQAREDRKKRVSVCSDTPRPCGV